MFERLHGHFAGTRLDDAAIDDYAATHARLYIALRSFFHPAAGGELLWNLSTRRSCARCSTRSTTSTGARLVERRLDRFEERVAPQWPRLRAQVAHGDLNLDNVLLDRRGRIAGIVDFGDCGHTAQVGRLRGRSRVLDARAADRTTSSGSPGSRSTATRRASRSNRSSSSCSATSSRARLAAIVSISAWRVRRFPENAAYIEAWDDDSWHLLELFDEPRCRCRRTGARRAARRSSATRRLARRRAERSARVLTPLTYSDPFTVTRGEGVVAPTTRTATGFSTPTTTCRSSATATRA